MNKVLLLTAIEVPFRGNLISDQFLSPILSSIPDKRQLRFEYLALAPITFFAARHQPVSVFIKSWSKAREVQKRNVRLGCRTTIIPVAYPLHPRDFNLTEAKHRFFLFWAVLPYLLYVLLSRPRLVIARSYPAATLALLSQKLMGIPYIFDLRGMYPEECVNAGIFTEDSKDYRYWKRQEKRLIESAGRNVVVSDPFKEHLQTIAFQTKVSIIPCCVDDTRIRYRPELKQQAKKKYGLENHFVLLHLGSFGTPGDRGLAAKYLVRFRIAKKDAVLVVVSGTKAFGPAIREAFLMEGLGTDGFRIFYPSEEELPELLALGDAGLILERKMPNTRVCLSVKLGEYLASGMPVICTPYVEGAARLVGQYRCGLVTDPDSDEFPKAEEQLLENYRQMQENGFKLVNEVLSLVHCRALWARILDETLNMSAGYQNR